MAKQKVVLRLYMKDAKKKSKALQTAARLVGVTFMAIEGEDKLVLVLEGTDPVILTESLRKQMGFCDIVNLAPFDEKKEEEKKKEEAKKKEEEKKKNEEKQQPVYAPPYYPPVIHYNEVPYRDPCRIL